MGKTSLKTAWRPVILRLDSGTSVWRNSTYESSWISMRLGGSAPSRSLPKYLRSDMEVARWTGFYRSPSLHSQKVESAWKWFGYCAVRPGDAKRQRRRNAGDDMRP